MLLVTQLLKTQGELVFLIQVQVLGPSSLPILRVREVPACFGVLCSSRDVSSCFLKGLV